MTTRKTLSGSNTFYYFTLTCYKWLKLFKITEFHDEIYNWFNFLKQKNIYTTAYVIMPNHLHSLIFNNNDSTPINKIIANGKRFMAYEIISRLKKKNEYRILNFLTYQISENERNKGVIHKVFEPSFDLKEVSSERFIHQKINYIHMNPVSKRWKLAETYLDYPYSSARYYEGLSYSGYPVLHYLDLIDMFLTESPPKSGETLGNP